MVGTFISKYLLITTSTITVTSSAAVTFFVAKHLKIGKGYEQMLDYMKDRYCTVVNDKSVSNHDITSINADIHLTLSKIRNSEELVSASNKEILEKYYEDIRSKLYKLEERNNKYLSRIQDDGKRLKLDEEYRRLQRILKEYVDPSLECSDTDF